MSVTVAGESVTRRVNAERVALLGWGRAILLQLAHPLVAAGVDEHSSFRDRPWSFATRLHHTVRAMLALTFADHAGRQRALEGILDIHRRVHGILREDAGRFTVGTPYSAEDPDLVLWVHATLLESIPIVYDLFVTALDDAQRDAYCAEAAPLALALGAREAEVPHTWRATLAYLDRQYATETIVVSRQARHVAGQVLAPTLAPLIFPAAWANRVITVGLLPPGVRQQYGFEWSPRDARAFTRLVPLVRRMRRLTPDRFALWPEARARANRHQ